MATAAGANTKRWPRDDLVEAMQLLPRAICLAVWMSKQNLCHWDLSLYHFFLKFWAGFFFLPHPPFFFGAVGDEAAFEREIRRHQTSHMQEVAMQAAMAAVQAAMQGGDNPAAAGVGPTPVPPPKAKAEAETKAEAKAKSSRKRKWTNVSLIHYFFRGYPKGMEWNFLKLNDFFCQFFFKAFEAEWKKWNDDWEAEKKAKSDAAPKVP